MVEHQVKCFCSETCFANFRRAAFKRTRNHQGLERQFCKYVILYA